MPTLSKPKHEIIANSLASGMSQADAYRAAGYVYKPANASRLCRTPSIEARVREIISERANSEAKAREIGIARVRADLNPLCTFNGLIKLALLYGITGHHVLRAESRSANG